MPLRVLARGSLSASAVALSLLAASGCGSDTTERGGATTAATSGSGAASPTSSSAGGSGPGGGAGGAGGVAPSGGGGTGGEITPVGSSATGNIIVCDTPPDVDDDKDGFTEQQGDCNDCDVFVNPAAVDVKVTEPGPDGKVPYPADEDCDGLADNDIVCDETGIFIQDFDPKKAARAIDLCKEQSGDSWGVVKAQWVRADGTPEAKAGGAKGVDEGIQAGLPDKFGSVLVPRYGKRMLALSSGSGRPKGTQGAANFFSKANRKGVTPPPNFPQNTGSCAPADNINDDVGFEVHLKVPSNATGYAFDFNFFTFEYPDFICNIYNDQFVALVDPPPAGSVNGNISFDSNKNPVSVNIAFFPVCKPNAKVPQFKCPNGVGELKGTGFGEGEWLTQKPANPPDASGGGTSWLETQAPATAGEIIKVRFAIWDTYDQAYDSTVLVDHFRWIASGGTIAVGTKPAPGPIGD